jgi:2-oxoglutarate ferredoxin oxidoreductase subunit gamma
MISGRNKIEIRFAGEGGQGLQAAASILGEAVMRSTDLYVCHSQNYGPESRGGLSYSDLILSVDEIDFPKIKSPDVLVCMSNESYLKFGKAMKSGYGFLLLLDPDMVTTATEKPEDSLRILHVPAAAVSESIFGTRIGANSVLLGALHTALSLEAPEAVEKLLKQTWPDLAKNNIQAFRTGIAIVREQDV